MTDNFNEWNLLLLREYFSPAVAGEEVWVQTNREELDAFGFHLGGAGGLIDTVKQGPSWGRQAARGMAYIATDLVKQRLGPIGRSRGYPDPGETIESYRERNAPTYLPYVAMWVLAASEQGKNGFYATVGDLVGLSFDGASAPRAMETLWRDLEHWSVRQANGAFGNFRSRPLGGYPFVGLAKAQALVTGNDRGGINRLFKQAGLAPGQELTKEAFSSLIDIAASSNYLSAGLREALKQFDIYGPVLEDIFQSRLAEWDGRLPTPKNRGRTGNGVEDADESEQDVEDELSLVLRPAFDVDWEIGWRLQATIEAASYSIVFDNVRYLAYPDETNRYITCVDPESGSQQAARSVLVDAIKHDVIASLIYARDGDENGEAKRSYCFTSKETRVMVWDTPNPVHGQELVERELPVAGAAYLLFSSDANLEYLDNERIEYQQVDSTEGLPSNWLLVLVPSIENLLLNQKWALQKLIGGTSDVLTRARIKFVGGCPILRGGAKQYAYYDLPTIEMEAPAKAVIRAEGLRIEEIFPEGASSQTELVTIRRFEIERESNDRHQFEVTASLGQETLSRAKLKVALASGAAIGFEKAFSIGRFGESVREASGIRGAALGSDLPEVNDVLEEEFLTSSPWGAVLSAQTEKEHFEDNIACKFLDMVAQKGAIEFGPARNLIKRLVQNTPGLQVNPVFLMLSLRSRGHIEIETDQKGHLLRVHAVTPTLYSLPVLDNSARQWYGVCGSLRLEHWRQLCNQSEIPGRFEAHATDQVPILRLSVSDQAELNRFSQASEFEVAALPAHRVIDWAGTLDETRERLQLNRGYENFRVKNQERLNPQSACFTHDGAEYMKVNEKRQCELFRFDDPVISGTQVYMLGSIVSSGVDFNYIQDSRWGIWLATSSFAKMLSEMYGISDAYPWPLPYSRAAGSFWLPARMKPPLVIERALCLCSGSGPQQVLTDEEADEDDDFVRLVDTRNNRKVIGRVSKVYTEMAKGTWFCYQWVPARFAHRLASHLGCELKEM